uniref:Salivary lipocalin n=1 Tax=Triatoma infestans TaxID=30076 RepID=A6YPF0_TRIIF|nr:salivary lipocalin [Triatoma infestans]
MKTFIAVTFLGILMHAYAQECNLRPAAKNFDSNKYFNIPLVYVTHTKSGLREDVCRKYETTNKRDGTSVTVVSADNTKGAPITPPKFTCTNKPKSGGDNGHFIVECKIPLGNGNSFQQTMEISVIATDNKNYAILNVCSTDDLDDILVLQTNKDSVDPGVEQFLKNKWDITTWGSRKSVGC